MKHEQTEFTLRYDNFVDNFDKHETVLESLTKEVLEDMYHEAKEIETEYNNFQLVVKADANSLYGSSASEYFALYSPRIAEDITQTGKHFTVLVDKAINNYFKHWSNEENLKKIQQFYPQVVAIRNFDEYKADSYDDICCYGDTDSRYVRLDLIYNLLLLSDGIPLEVPENDDDYIKFALFLNDEYFTKILKESIEADCNARNAKIGRMKMALEVIARKTSFIKKKKYIMHIIWQDGKTIKDGKMKFQGVEIKRGSTSDKAKEILKRLVVKFMKDGISQEEIRKDCLKVMKFIQLKRDKELIYQLTSVSGLSGIRLENNRYVSDKTHIQMQIALSWYNFVHENKLYDLYQMPFEGQKMQYYYCAEGSNYKLIGIPDNIDISEIPNLPEPDWKRMTIISIIKPLCRYIINKSEISDEDIENFLLGVSDVRSLFD